MIKISDGARSRVRDNARTDLDRRARELLIALMDEGLAAADPRAMIRKCVNITVERLSFVGVDGSMAEFDLRNLKNIYVVGPGKANGAMAEELERIFYERNKIKKIARGLVIAHDRNVQDYVTKRIELRGASLPLPDENGMKAAEEILEIAGAADEDDLVICLISGGGSPLMPLPPKEVLLEDKRELIRTLSRAGANIKELNIVRKHLSEIKGGRLAGKAFPAHVVALILSDVVGDDLSSIASGPTSPDSLNSTFQEAINILQRYRLWENAPDSVKDYLTKGTANKAPEVLQAGNPCFEKVHNIILGNNSASILTIHREAERRRLNSAVLSHFLEGEAREVGKLFSGVAKSITKFGDPLRRPAVLLAGGETTVTVRGNGQGGRNQELALSASMSLDSDMDGVAIAALASDGKEAFTDGAGAIVDAKTVSRARGLELDPLSHLLNNNSYDFFRRVGDLLTTDPSPSGTNVNDFIILCVL